MKEEILNEEFRRMQELAGIKTENGIQLSDPELAVKWWSQMEEQEKQELLDEYLPDFPMEKMNHQNIYWLWLKQQKL